MNNNDKAFIIQVGAIKSWITINFGCQTFFSTPGPPFSAQHVEKVLHTPFR